MSSHILGLLSRALRLAMQNVIVTGAGDLKVWVQWSAVPVDCASGGKLFWRETFTEEDVYYGPERDGSVYSSDMDSLDVSQVSKAENHADKSQKAQHQ